MKIREARREDAPAIAYVHVNSWRTTYEGVVPQAFLNDLNVEQRTASWEEIIASKQTAIFVAENDEDEVVGFVSGGQERSGEYSPGRGEIFAIYLLKEVQGQGIGRKLLAPFIERLKEEGYESLLVWVLEENPSRTFYEKLGGDIIDSDTIKIAGKTFDEIGYGWEDINEVEV
ncbi:GNAT family N-acetyltransferase [Salsuginibacillus kocurii]|uniref:GNAT family N-acetyltransferase n=1 Tax=Salsuginibacillus kocurii TaxID=427078 RepID=UPI00036F56EB|nr:GNAT family N-acetyltransferase [Salsuginibacillus kocurii]